MSVENKARASLEARTIAICSRPRRACSVTAHWFLGLHLLLFLLPLPCRGQDKLTPTSAPSARLIEMFSDSKDGAGTGRDPGLTDDQFLKMLTSASGHSEKYIRQVLGPCGEGDAQSNCTSGAVCPGTEEIYKAFSVAGQLREQGLKDALPVALSTLAAPACTAHADSGRGVYHAKRKSRPTLTQTWLYGLGFCTLVAVFISNIGAFLGPCLNSRFFKRLLQFLVSMGAGSLATTGLLVLIPEAFDIMSVEELADAYVWKATLAILSIFTFFSLERLLKTFLYNHKKNKKSLPSAADEENHLHLMTQNHHTKESTNGGGDATDVKGHGHSHDLGEGQGKEEKLTLAWMVMGGDVMHNFVDGLSVGAAFTEDLSLGISVSLAIVCEELPHELADIAILLHSGLPIKKAIFINFVSACSIYLGLILGILIGSNIHAANLWIFSLAGGLFLYIPLVDMLPDMRTHLDQLLASGSKEAKMVAVLHFLGLLVGTGIIVCIVNVSGYIDVE